MFGPQTKDLPRSIYVMLLHRTSCNAVIALHSVSTLLRLISHYGRAKSTQQAADAIIWDYIM